MGPRIEPLRPPPVLFAHRGARAHAPENTLEAFTLAVRLGATGLESDVWLTEDGVAVLDHDGVVGGRLRRRAISRVTSGELPPHIPTLTQLYEEVGTRLPLSLDVKDPAAIDEVLRVARTAGAVARLWLCHHDLALLEEWRGHSDAAVLVHSTYRGFIDGPPERHAARLRDSGVDAINLHHTEWSGGLVALYHRFGRLALGWDAQHDRVIDALLHQGLDGVYSDHVDRLVDAARRADEGAG
ncbi:MAG: glycerophosphodiester phosphodiesterase [Microthrixaceae bacterium]